MTTTLRPLLLATLALTAACDPTDSVGIGGDYDPRNLDAAYEWVLDRWDEGDAEGHPVVALSWEIPPRYSDEAFRVYARGGSAGSYILIATVTSCSDGVCRYDDTNVVNGGSYDYYVATVDEWDGSEWGSSEAIRVDLPDFDPVEVPGTPTAISLDGAAYLYWAATGAQRYFILSELEDGDVFLIGETDGTSFLDDRAANGARHRYYLAAVDVNEHVSDLSSPADAYPRPDFHSDIVYSNSANADASGFRFVANPDEGDNPIVSGAAADRDWRLVETNGVLRIEPAPGNTITGGEFTTQLTCGPGSEGGSSAVPCVDIRTAPAANEFGLASVAVRAGHTYVIRLVDGSQVRFAKIRVQGESTDSQSRRLIVFDWAYQTRVNEPSLDLIPR